MRKKSLIILSVMAVMAAFVGLNAQNQDQPQSQVKSKVPINAALTDNRFELDNVTFFKRMENTYMSLNVNFDLKNHTDKDLKLKLYLIAYCETDNVDDGFRKWFKYPQWRKRDLDKEVKKYLIVDSIPELDKKNVDNSFSKPNEFPSFQKYLQYINGNPDTGFDITVQGVNSGSKSQSNAKNISVVNQAMKTSVFAKLTVGFNPGNKFFNHFAVVITDPEQKKIVTTQLYYFNKPFRVY